MEPLVENISDTARWVAVFRADESDRSDAVFNDPFARRLAGEKGEQIANAIEFSRKNSWSFVARTWLFDHFIKQQVDAGYDTVINLAAGLDTRPYRMDLPGSLHWYDVDLPGILDYKKNILSGEIAKCKYEAIVLDLSNREERLKLFNRLNKKTKKALVVSEGLIIYLTAEEAGSLAEDLSAQQRFHRWLLDMQSPGLLALVQKEMGSQLASGNTVFKFAPAEGEEFFTRYGWKPIESRSKFKTAATLNRLSPEMMEFAAIPEPEGPKGDFPWSGACLFENMNYS